MGMRTALVAASFMAVAAQAQAAPTLEQEMSGLSHTCGLPLKSRAMAYLLSNDAQRPSVSVITASSLECIGDPEPTHPDLPRKLAYMLTQQLPAHVVDQARVKNMKPDFTIRYQDTSVRAVFIGSSIETEMISNNPLMCHNYNYLARSPEGMVANGSLAVCYALNRDQRGNLPKPDLAAIAALPLPARVSERGPSEPRDSRYYDPYYRPR